MLERDHASRELKSVTAKYLAAEKKLERLISPSLLRLTKSTTNTQDDNENNNDNVDLKHDTPPSNDSNVVDATLNKATAQMVLELESTKASLEESQVMVNRQLKQLLSKTSQN
jgi:hypothetical protein